jgi:hypothetical protein
MDAKDFCFAETVEKSSWAWKTLGVDVFGDESECTDPLFCLTELMIVLWYGANVQMDAA